MDTTITKNEVCLKRNGIITRISSPAHGILHIVASKNENLSSDTSIVAGCVKESRIPLDVKKTGSNIEIAGFGGTLRIDEQQSMQLLNGQGESIITEPVDARSFAEVPVFATRFNPENGFRMIKTIDGERMMPNDYEHYFDRHEYQIRVDFQFRDGEKIYGLGCHEEDEFNYRGKEQFLIQANMKIAMPILYSSLRYALLFDCESYMIFRDTDEGSYMWGDCASVIDYYICFHDDFGEILKNIRYLTGKASMLPKWSFGYIQSKERYLNSDELMETAREYRRRDIPIDCIVQDWKSWEDDQWGQKTFDKNRYGDLSLLTNELHDLGVRIIVSIWPNMALTCKDNQEMLAQNYLLADGSTYDAFNINARKTYYRQAFDGIYQHGIDGWWSDNTEPFSEVDWSGEEKKKPKERYADLSNHAKKFMDATKTNAYSLEHSKSLYYGQRSIGTCKRVINLTRSCYPGQQRYGTVCWSGDISAKYSVLKSSVTNALNFVITGHPYFTFDIGGFFTGNTECFHRWSNNTTAPKPWFWDGDYETGVQDYGYRELYVRWLQAAAFMPMFRSHGTDTPREIWQFGESGEMFYDAIASFIRLRYHLLPYLYSIAGQVHHYDRNIIYPLFFAFMDDPLTYDLSTQFMFGPSIMICPVYEAMYYRPGSIPIPDHPKTIDAYLPKGTDWYDYWTGERYHGGIWISAQADITRIPIYVRAGAILPVCNAHVKNVDDATVDEIVVYRGEDGDFDLYEDEGDGYAYENGEYQFYHLHYSNTTGAMTNTDIPYKIRYIGEQICSF
jgi:alpha-D-xyloside xylohydrolase